MDQQALRGYEKALGEQLVATYLPALNTLENLGALFNRSGRIEQALLYYSHAATGVEVEYEIQSQLYQWLAPKLEDVT